MNTLIVEGKEDKAFLEYLLKNELNIIDVEIQNPPLIEIKELGGLSSEALEKQIASIINKIIKNPIEKLGIIIDLDDLPTGGGFDERLKTVNTAIKNAFEKNFKQRKKIDFNIPVISGINKFINIFIDDKTSVEIACFFIHLNGKGELEDLLREIKIHDSHHADCLEVWRECLNFKKIQKSDKEINKLWLHYYIRYDICTQDEQEHAGKYCNLKHVLNDDGRKERLFNFEHECLDELKFFLKLFKNEIVVSE